MQIICAKLILYSINLCFAKHKFKKQLIYYAYQLLCSLDSEHSSNKKQLYKTKKGKVSVMVLKSKTVSYGLVELCQNGSMYSIEVNGQIREQSRDLTYLSQLFDSKYY